jgi:hypothetical protein
MPADRRIPLPQYFFIQTEIKNLFSIRKYLFIHSTSKIIGKTNKSAFITKKKKKKVQKKEKTKEHKRIY